MNRLLKTLKEHPILIVLLLGLVYRLIFLLSYYYSPDWEQLLVDSLFHDRWAMSIAAGNIAGEDTFFRAPFYIYLLGFIYAIVGHSLMAARIFGHMVGLAAVALTYLIATRLFSRRIGLIAGIIHALYPIAVYFESELLVDNLFAMLMELSFWLLLISADKKQMKYFILTGLVIGLAAVTRPVILALTPLYLIWIFIKIGPAANSIKNAVQLILGLILMITPVTLRNYMVADDFVLISSSGGINFFIGNNPDADGLSAAMPRPLGRNWEIKDIKFAAEEETGRTMRASEVSNFWMQKGLGWAKDNPGDFIRLYGKKLYHCINNFEISNNRNLKLFMGGFNIFKMTPLDFAVLFTMSIFGLGMLLINRRLGGSNLLMLAFIVIYMLVISLFFINARFRLPVIPYIIIFGAVGIDYLISIIKSPRLIKRAVPAAVVAVAACFISVTNVYGLNRNDTAGGYFNRANYYLYLKDLDKAADYYRLALDENPRYAEINLNMGVVQLKMGRGDSAEHYFKRELAQFPDNPRAYTNLASLYYLEEDYDRAEEKARAALEIKPYFVDAHILLMRIYHARGDTAALDNIMNRSIPAAVDDGRIYLNAGLLYSNMKMYDRAVEFLQKAVNHPDPPAETNDFNFNYTRLRDAAPSRIRARAAYQLGYLYGILDRIPQSIEMSRMAIALDSSLTEAYINLINAYAITGQHREAIRLLDIARARFPDNEILKIMSERL